MQRIKQIFNEKVFIFLWLLFIPTQLGKHFWPEWSHVLGLRVDYLSPILYFGDLLWLTMVFILQFWRSNPSPRLGNRVPPLDRARWGKIFNFQNLIILLFVGVNILVAVNRWEAGYKWLRIAQWWLTFKIILENRDLFKEMLFKVLPFWIIGEGLLAVAQVINGGSLNGIFYWLGERRFSYSTLGVAQISYLGEGLIRAYGTFSHPNSLAGFILVALILWTRSQISDVRSQKDRIFYWSVVFCGLLGIFLAGSRTIWLIGIAILIFNFQFSIKNWKKGLGILLIGGGLLTLVLSLISSNYRISDFIGGWDRDGLAKRGGLIVASLKMIKDSPLFGVGAGNFLVRLPEYQRNSGVFWLQPVHNIVMLIIAEFGLLGLVLIMKFLFSHLRFLNNPKFMNKNVYKFVVVGIILITGMVDHYWLTLPQNVWLLCIVLGIL